jgi:hypothetical protein
MKSSYESQILLPRGWWTGDRWEQRVGFRAVDDCEEESLLEQIDAMLPFERDSALLASYVLGPEGVPLTPSQVRELSIGDRETLLLWLRRSMLGNTIQCVLRCPACSEKMELQLNVDELTLERELDPQFHYEDVVQLDDERLLVTFHIPTGADLEEAIRVASGVPEKAVVALAQRCVEEVLRNTDDPAAPQVPTSPDDWPQSLFPEISARIEKLDPQAELKIDLACPACGHHFEDFIDAGGLLLQELTARQRLRYREVHQLAKAYHWSEADILRMSPRKRQLYLDLLAADDD